MNPNHIKSLRTGNVRTAAKIITIAAFLSVLSSAHADEMSCRMSLDREKIAPGKQALLEIELPLSYGAVAPELPVINDINIRFIKTYPKNVQDAGSGPDVNVFQYKVAPRTPGVFTIGPFSFQSGPDIFRTQTVMLTVEKEVARPLPEQAPQESDLKSRIFVSVETPKTTIFINEKAPVYLKLYTDWIDLENVSFAQRQSEYLLMKEFKDKTVEMVDKGAERFAVLKYTSSFYAVTAGNYSIEPVSVKFTLAMPQMGSDGKAPDLLNMNSSFYGSFIGASGSRAIELESEPVSITVLPLPAENKPKSFRGAVGMFNFELKADKRSVRPGESVTLTAIISGSGNYDAISPPIPADPAGIKINEAKVTRSPESVAYEMLLTVQSGELRSLPGLIFTYFDPSNKAYNTIERTIPVNLENIRIAAKSLLKEDQKTKRPIEVRILPIKASLYGACANTNRPYRGVIFWILFAIPPVAVPAAILRDRRRRYLETHPMYAALLQASRGAARSIRSAERSFKEGDADSFYLAVFKMLQEYIGTRVLMSPEGVTGQTVHDLIETYVGNDLACRIRRIFDDCYSARYSSKAKSRDAMRETLKEVIGVVSELNKKEFSEKDKV